MLDVLNLITFLGAVQGIFFGLLLLRLSDGNRWANRMLALFLVVFSVSMLGIVAYSSQWVLRAPHLALLHAPFAAATAAPMYLYILALTRKQFRLRWRHALLFLPFLLVLLWFLPFYCLPAADKHAILLASYTALPADWKASFTFSLLCNCAGLVATYVLILRHERVIREVYSSPKGHTLLWARHFFYAGAATFALCALVSLFSINWADPVSNLLFSAIIYVFGYRALRQPEIFTDISEAAMPATPDVPLIHRGAKYEKSGLSDARAQALLDQLTHLMTAEKIYLDPNLNVQQLADRLGAPPHQVSQLLNQFQGETFSDFVNRYRVEHFKQAVTDPANAHFSVLALAFDSGFNSKAAFNAVFKKMTGQTPSDFKSARP